MICLHLWSVLLWHSLWIFSVQAIFRLQNAANVHDLSQGAYSVEIPERVRSASTADIANARTLVRDALAEVAKYNQARLAHAARTPYPRSNATSQSILAVPPLYRPSREIAAAAALLAEVDALEDYDGSHLPSKRSANFWMETITRRGAWPFGNRPDYKVFRNVKEYGARGDGLHDDTAAILMAMAGGQRCGERCNGDTRTNAIVYFPPGTYLVSGSIPTFYGTQMIGDANNWPTIKAARSFIGLGMISTDVYVENGGSNADGSAKEWFVNTANFYRQIRNFNLDITQTHGNISAAALHYQVAQATSLSNIAFFSALDPGTTQQAIFSENGSGGQMSDLTFIGGKFGIYGGNQQFTAQRLKFFNCQTAVQLIWDWGWTWKNIEIHSSKTGFKLVSEDGVYRTGSVLILDSKFISTETAILTLAAQQNIGSGTTGITLDNVGFQNVGKAVADDKGRVYLAGGTSNVDTWVLGPTYSSSEAKRDFSLGMAFESPRLSTMLGDDIGLPKKPFFERPRPQYESLGTNDFISAKASGAKGDGQSDDTKALQWIVDALAARQSNEVLFLEAGAYILTDTLTLPSGLRIVGEAWSQLVAFGPNFSDEMNPRPLIQVGRPGEIGRLELQDLIFTTKGPTAGATLIEWNLQAESPGAAAMWDCHIRVGGAAGTSLTSLECPITQLKPLEACKAGSALLHLTPSASAYIENFWAWVADHDIDDSKPWSDTNDLTQTSIYVARGVLIESTNPSWLYGTASEHSVLYQYNFFGAKNIFAGMIQTETPYYQPMPRPPAPFENSIGRFNGDSDFSCTRGDDCDAAWGVYMTNCSDVQIAGAGIYSWFSDYSQACVDDRACQKALIKLDRNHGNVRLQNIITIGATISIVSDGVMVFSLDNLATTQHPVWSQISQFEPAEKETSIVQQRCSNGLLPIQRLAVQDQITRNFTSYDTMINVGAAYTNQTGLGWSPPDPIEDKRGSAHSITILNATPHRFKLKGAHAYQIGRDWQWTDIPSGQAFTVSFEYTVTGQYRQDDKAEAYFELEGTGKTFTVKVRSDRGKNNRNPDFVEIEYTNLDVKGFSRGSSEVRQFLEDSNHVSWVLIGSMNNSFQTAASISGASWMQDTLHHIGRRQLRHICMPGSHDAGIYTISSAGMVGSTPNFCQTQGVSIFDQLSLGSRWFDVRPVLGSPPSSLGLSPAAHNFYAGHFNGNPDGSEFHVGCLGAGLDQIIDDVNRFTESNAELIILWISHTMDTDRHFSPMTDAEWANLYDRLERVSNRRPNLAGDLTQIRLSSLIGHGSASVLIITEGPFDRPASGIYAQQRYFPRIDRYTDTDILEGMVKDQAAKLHKERNIIEGPARRDTFFIESWTLTQELPADLAVPIQRLSSWAEAALFQQAWQEFTPFSFPNVINMNYIGGVLQTDFGSKDPLSVAALAVAVNTYLGDQNCYINSV